MAQKAKMIQLRVPVTAGDSGGAVFCLSSTSAPSPWSRETSLLVSAMIGIASPLGDVAFAQAIASRQS
ncbi:hypothetical protein KC363_g61 [Hortaea werneckii]|nr:hypothetical protein KC363_g61 [Hortaea werneckii]